MAVAGAFGRFECDDRGLFDGPLLEPEMCNVVDDVKDRMEGVERDVDLAFRLFLLVSLVAL